MYEYEKYKSLKEKKGITDYQISKETGISTSTLSNWKKGVYKPKIDKILILSRYFGVSVEYFIAPAEKSIS